MTSGATKDETTQLQVTKGFPGSAVLRAGDRIRMSYFAKAPPDQQYTFDDFQRSNPMILLGVVFALAVVCSSAASRGCGPSSAWR